MPSASKSKIYGSSVSWKACRTACPFPLFLWMMKSAWCFLVTSSVLSVELPSITVIFANPSFSNSSKSVPMVFSSFLVGIITLTASKFIEVVFVWLLFKIVCSSLLCFRYPLLLNRNIG